MLKKLVGDRGFEPPMAGGAQCRAAFPLVTRERNGGTYRLSSLSSDADDADVSLERTGQPGHVVDVGREYDRWVRG